MVLVGRSAPASVDAKTLTQRTEGTRPTMPGIEAMQQEFKTGRK
jgi:hypothetical protein